MLDAIRFVFSLLRSLSPAQAARVTAHWTAPGAIMLFTTSGVLGGFFPGDTGVPVTVAELRTELLPNGSMAARRGMVFLVEPTETNFKIIVDPPPSHIWSSLDKTEAHENRDRLLADGRSVAIEAPFFGVDAPVTVVVEGSVARSIQVPGGTEPIDNLLARSKKSIVVVASVLLACMFAFGMSSASGMPSLDSKQ